MKPTKDQQKIYKKLQANKRLYLPGHTEDEYDNMLIEARYCYLEKEYYIVSIVHKTTGEVLWPKR